MPDKPTYEELERRVKLLEKDAIQQTETERNLQESEEPFRTFVEESPVATVISTQGKIQYVNPAYLRMLAYDKEANLAGSSLFDNVAPECREEIANNIVRRSCGEDVPNRYEIIALKQDGSRVPCQVEVNLMDLPDGQASVAILTDLTERKLVEETLRRSEVLEQLATGASLSKILTELVLNTEKYNPDTLCTVLLLDEDGRHLRHGAAPSLPDSYNEAIDGIEIGPEVGSCGAAAYTDERVIVEDIMTHPNWKDYRLLAKQAGLAACWSEPVVSSTSDVLGTFAIYYREPRSPQRKDLDFIKDSARLAGIAIESKRLENKRIKALRDVSSIMESIPDLIYMLDLGGRLVNWNKSVEERSGYSADELKGMPALELIHEEDRRSIAKAFEKQSAVKEARLLSKEGNAELHLFSGRVMRDEEGKIIGIVGSGKDISDLKQVEEALRESKERYALAVRGANDGLWDRNLETEEVYYSPRWKEILGYKDDEIPNRHEEWQKRIHPDDYDQIMRDVDNHLAGKTEHYSSEYRMKHKDGSYQWVLARGATTKDEQGNRTRFAGSLTDITDRKKAEKEKDELQRQLQQAQKMESIGRLAGGIAHDFNNILTPLFTYTELTRQEIPRESEARQFLDGVQTSAERAKDLVKQILTFSRRDEQERKAVQVDIIVTEALKLLRSTIPSTIEIHHNIDTECGAVLADPTQIHQVLINLCTNAYHAMSENGGMLEVELAATEINGEFARRHMNLQPGEHVRLTINDTGHGMDEETLERIFDPFFTTKEIGKGTGLGLSVVHRIVLNHGGEIMVRSEPGEGTTFDVYFPVADTVPPDNKSTNDEEFAPRGKESILFVDDEIRISLALKPMLERFGYKFTASSCSVEVLEKFRANPNKYDLVVTDYTMPKMTGTQLSMELRKIRPDIPVILTSGFNDIVTSENFKQFGISEYILKPYDAHQLGKIIRQVLDVETTA